MDPANADGGPIDAEQRLRLALRASRMGLWEWNLSSGRVTGSALLFDLFGIRPDEFDGTFIDVIRRIHPEDQALVAESSWRAMETGQGCRLEFRALRPDGGIRWLEGHAEILLDANSRPDRLLGLVADITDRKLAQLAIEHSEHRYRLLAEQLSDGIFIADATGRYVDANQAGCRMLGYTLDELRQKSIRDVLTPDQLPALPQQFQLLPHNQIVVKEWTFLRKDGSTFVGELAGSALPDGGYQGVVRDITPRRLAEENLRHSENRYRHLHESLRDGFVEVSMDGRIREFNAIYCQMLGYSPEELRRLTYIDITPQRWHDMEAAIVRDQILIRGYSDVYEKEYRHKDGTAFPVELRTILIRDPAGNPESMWAAVRDISARKRDEDELRASRAFLNRITQDVPVVVEVFDLDDMQPVWTNGASARLLGRSLSELRALGSNVVPALMHPDDIPTALRHFEELRHSQSDDPIEFEFRMRHADGSWRWFVTSERPYLRHPDGRVSQILISAHDITERKQAAEALRAAEERHAYLVRLSDALRPLANPADIQSTASRILGEHLRASRVLYAEIDGDRAIISRDYVNGVSSIAGSFRVHDFGSYVVQTHLNDEIVQSSDTAADPHLSPSARLCFAQIQAAADLSKGLLKEGRWVGALAVHHAVPRVWTPLEIRLVEETAERTWAALERAKAESALRTRESQLQAALSSMADAVLITGVDGAFIEFNEAFAVFFRFSSKAECARVYHDHAALFDLFLPNGDPVPEERRPASRALRGESAANAEYTLTRRDSGQSWIGSFTFAPIRDASGAIAGAVVVARDITQSKRAEEEIRIAQERLQMTVDLCEVGIGYLDLLTGESASNAAPFSQIGGPPEIHLASELFLPSLHEEDRQKFSAAYQACVTRGEPADLQYRLVNDSGRIRWMRTILRALHSTPKPRYLCYVTLDVTAQKHVEQVLRSANEDLNRYAYAIAHDLREPLRNIAASTQLLTDSFTGTLKPLPPPQVTRLKGFVTEGVHRMDRLLSDLLEYSRAGDQTVDSSLVDARSALDKALANLSEAIRASGAELSISPLPSIYVRESELVSIFQNLVANAIHYCRPDVPPKIDVQCSRRAGHWHFSVKDNGTGFDPQYAQYVFGMFKRLHGKDKPGTGIGLALCHRIVTKHGGAIWADSQPGRGSDFQFTWPVAPHSLTPTAAQFETGPTP